MTPAPPATAASTTLSVCSCRARRQRPAPSARGEAQARAARARPRASTRLQTLPQPISSTNKPAPSSTSRGVRTLPTTASRKGRTLTPRSVFDAGKRRFEGERDRSQLCLCRRDAHIRFQPRQPAQVARSSGTCAQVELGRPCRSAMPVGIQSPQAAHRRSRAECR